VKLRALDLFCGAGGVSEGLRRAGFEVTGVDLAEQPRYRGGVFVQDDALEYPLGGFDFIWASPPCQAHTALRSVTGGREYPDLIPATRDRLQGSGIPWVIENVPGAPLRHGFMLCGQSFGLKVYRHRLFEPSFGVLSPPCPGHPEAVPKAGRGPSPGGYICVTGNTVGAVEFGGPAMGIDWMNRRELSQAIPPAYAEWIGWHAAEHILAKRGV